MLVRMPVGTQHVRELVHRLHAGHQEVHSAGMLVTGVLTCTLVAADLLYLVRPGEQAEYMHAPRQGSSRVSC